MKCLRCHTENRDSVSYCEKCGSLLYRRRKADRFRKARITGALAVLLVCIAGLLYFLHMKIFTSDQPAVATAVINEVTDMKSMLVEKNKALPLPATGKKTEMKIADKIASSAQDSITPVVTDSGNDVTAGWVIITDPWGRQVRKFRAGLAGSGWLHFQHGHVSLEAGGFSFPIPARE